MINFNENDIFIVSGSTSGIGKALTIELNRLGAIVIAIGRNHDKFNNLKKYCIINCRLEYKTRCFIFINVS